MMFLISQIKIFQKRKKCSYSILNRGSAILFILGFICELTCMEYKQAENNSHVIPGTRQIDGDENFSVAKNFNRKDNYGETFSMQNEIFPSCIRTKGYENYKLLSIKISCRDRNSRDSSATFSEMLSDGEKNKALHAKHKFEKVLRVFQQGK